MTRKLWKCYDRIMRKSDLDEETGCLICTYSCGSHGYAQAWDGVTVVLAHRIVWEWHHGPIPPGMTVDHVCRNRRCVQVEHLRLLPNLENARRTQGRDWPLGTCVHGHHQSWWVPKTPERVKGYCLGCRRIQWHRRQGNPLPTTDFTQPKPDGFRTRITDPF